jgi:mannose PTS system EIIC component
MPLQWQRLICGRSLNENEREECATMFGMSIFQVLLILLVVIVFALDVYGPQSLFFYWNIPVGLLVGLILGDWHTGLIIGATVGLMSLGVIGAGGASIPSYFLTCIVTTIVAIQSHAGIEVGLAIGIPVGMMSIYLDVFIKIINGYIASYSQAKINKKEFSKGINVLYSGMVLNILQYIIPVCFIIFAGQAITSAVVSYMPTWLFGGLTVAGKLLPAVGLAALLNFMPVRKHFAYLLVGYVFASYLGASTLAISILGISAAVIFYQRESKMTAVEGGMEDE